MGGRNCTLERRLAPLILRFLNLAKSQKTTLIDLRVFKGCEASQISPYLANFTFLRLERSAHFPYSLHLRTLKRCLPLPAAPAHPETSFPRAPYPCPSPWSFPCPQPSLCPALLDQLHFLSTQSPCPCPFWYIDCCWVHEVFIGCNLSNFCFP